MAKVTPARKQYLDFKAQLPGSIVMFRMGDFYECFDDDAKDWSNMYSMMDGNGVCVFDANGDGRPDVYVPQDGQNWTRPCDANGVLIDEPRYMASMLYLNQGNDEAGRPLFKSLKELVVANPTLQQEELLIENFLEPRTSAEDSSKRFGRAATCAICAGSSRPA